MFGALGTPCLAVFSGSDPPLPKGEAMYSQWAFEVHSLQSCYQEGVLQEGIIQSLKGNAADMVHFLGPAPSVKAILDKLDSIWLGVSLRCHEAGVLQGIPEKEQVFCPLHQKVRRKIE